MNTSCRNAHSLLNSLVTKMPLICRNSSFYMAVKSTMYCKVPNVVDATSPSCSVGNFHVQNPPEMKHNCPQAELIFVLHRRNPFRIAFIAFYHSSQYFLKISNKNSNMASNHLTSPAKNGIICSTFRTVLICLIQARILHITWNVQITQK